MTQTQQNQPLPRQFGKYVLVRKLAMGGMAEVFKAKTAGAEGFEKDVVIKRILPHFTEDESFVKMFIDEASITSKLQHANIVQIFDFDVCEGSYYIAMEIVEGEDLKKVIDVGIKSGKPLSTAQTVWLMMELSKGLHYAHTKEHKGQPLNIVHRDISPHNAMVSYNGEVKLMDFGIAKAAQRSTKTMAGTVKGKVAYMSPEQARGKNLDGRSDLFALGIMMWEMLTAKRLFLGDSDFETLTAVLKNDAPPPSSLNPKVPKDLDEIVLKALKKDRDERYASVEAFARDLTRWYYSNVTDLEAESLKKYMHDVFAGPIADLKRLTEEERGLPAPGGGQMAQSERTMAMPASDLGPAPAEFSQSRPVQRHSTASSMQAMQPGTGSYAQAPQMTSMTGAYGAGAGVQPVQQKSKAWLWILLVLLLGGGGAAAAIILTQGGGSGGSAGGQQQATNQATAPTPPKETAEVVLDITPRTAKVKVDGKAADEKVTGLEQGTSVKVEVEAEGYESQSQIVTLEKKSNIVKIELVKKKAKVAFTIIVENDDQAVVQLNGKDAGKGNANVEGVEGDSVEIVVTPSKGGDPTKETVVLKPGMDNVKKMKVTEPEVSVILKIEPAGAKVSCDKGTVEMSGDNATVKGLKVNDVIKCMVEKADYVGWSDPITVVKDAQEVPVKLAKKAGGSTTNPNDPKPNPNPTPTGTGKVTVLARPWAKVSIGGRPYGNAPTTIDMNAGKVTVTCVRNAITKTVSVTVKSGQTVTAQCGDMQ